MPTAVLLPWGRAPPKVSSDKHKGGVSSFSKERFDLSLIKTQEKTTKRKGIAAPLPCLRCVWLHATMDWRGTGIVGLVLQAGRDLEMCGQMGHRQRNLSHVLQPR